MAVLAATGATTKAAGTAMILERDITLVYGMTGMGKTRWTRAYLDAIKRPRIFVMDTQVEHSGILFDGLGGMIDHVLHYPTFKVRTEYVDDFPMLCSIAYAAGHCCLVVEETQRVLPASYREPPSSFLDIVYRGRHRGVSLVMVSQRPSTVHIAARSQWNRIVCFRQTEPADVDWIESVAGVSIDPLSLPQSHYYEITPSGSQKKALDTGTKRAYTQREPATSAESVPADGGDES